MQISSLILSFLTRINLLIINTLTWIDRKMANFKLAVVPLVVGDDVIYKPMMLDPESTYIYHYFNRFTCTNLKHFKPCDVYDSHSDKYKCVVIDDSFALKKIDFN